jgi:hypothetical protein
MYDILTSSLLFIILTPGVLLTIPPTGGIMAAIVHAVVFYVVQSFLSKLVPAWGILVLAVVVVGLKIWASRSTPTV